MSIIAESFIQNVENTQAENKKTYFGCWFMYRKKYPHSNEKSIHFSLTEETHTHKDMQSPFSLSSHSFFDAKRFMRMRIDMEVRLKAIQKI